MWIFEDYIKIELTRVWQPVVQCIQWIKKFDVYIRKTGLNIARDETSHIPIPDFRYGIWCRAKIEFVLMAREFLMHEFSTILFFCSKAYVRIDNWKFLKQFCVRWMVNVHKKSDLEPSCQAVRRRNNKLYRWYKAHVGAPRKILCYPVTSKAKDENR